MGNNYKTCDIHQKAFPANMIDTDESEMVSIYVEKQTTIEGKKVKVSLFVGKGETQGIDSCLHCMTEAIIERIRATGKDIAWKVEKWEEQELPRKDGTTYKKNVPVVRSIEEMRELIKADNGKSKTAPTITK